MALFDAKTADLFQSQKNCAWFQYTVNAASRSYLVVAQNGLLRGKKVLGNATMVGVKTETW